MVWKPPEQEGSSGAVLRPQPEQEGSHGVKILMPLNCTMALICCLEKHQTSAY